MNAAVFDAILCDIAAGEATHKVLSTYLKPRKEFYAYLASNQDAGNRYARAKHDGMEVLADEMLEIADDSTSDIIVDDEGRERTNAEVVARSRLRVDTRKWLLSKLAPKKYGERVDLTHAGPDGGAILQRIENVIVDPKG